MELRLLPRRDALVPLLMLLLLLVVVVHVHATPRLEMVVTSSAASGGGAGTTSLGVETNNIRGWYGIPSGGATASHRGQPTPTNFEKSNENHCS